MDLCTEKNQNCHQEEHVEKVESILIENIVMGTVVIFCLKSKLAPIHILL